MDGIQISSTARLDKDGARPGVHNGNLRLFYQDSSTPRWTATFPRETEFQFNDIDSDRWPGGQFNSFVEISTDFSTDFSTEFLL